MEFNFSVTPSEEATTPNSELRRVSVSQAPSQQLPHNEPSPNLMPDSSGSPVSSAPTSLHFRVNYKILLTINLLLILIFIYIIKIENFILLYIFFNPFLLQGTIFEIYNFVS